MSEDKKSIDVDLADGETTSKDGTDKREHFMSIYDDMPSDAIDYLLQTYPKGDKKGESRPAKTVDTRRKRMREEKFEEESVTLSDDFNFSEFMSKLNIANVTLIAIVLLFGIAVLFLVIRTNGIIKEKDELTVQLEDYNATKQSYETLKLDYDTLKEENDALLKVTEPVSNTSQSNSQQTGSNQGTTSSSSEIPETYTMIKGETLWVVAKRFYGRGELYIKIMEENGIKDDKKVGAGTVIKLPKIEN